MTIKKSDKPIAKKLVNLILKEDTQLYSVEGMGAELKKGPSSRRGKNWLTFKSDTLTGILKKDFDMDAPDYENKDEVYNFRAKLSDPVFLIHFDGRHSDDDNGYKILFFFDSYRVVYDWPFELQDKLTKKIKKQTGSFKRYVASLGYVNALKYDRESYGKMLKNTYTNNRIYTREKLRVMLNKVKDDTTLYLTLDGIDEKLKGKYDTTRITPSQAIYNLHILYLSLLNFVGSNQNLKSDDTKVADSLINKLDFQIDKLNRPIILDGVTNKIDKIKKKIDTNAYSLSGSTRDNDLDKIIDSIYAYEKELKDRYNKATRQSALLRVQGVPVEHEATDYLKGKGYSDSDLID